MSVHDDLFAIEEGFWLAGSDHFAAHLDDRCLLAFPQAGEKHGIRSAEHVAATATPSNRRRDLSTTNRHALELTADVAIISYRAEVTRADGQPYAAFVRSACGRRGDEWKLAFRQLSPVWGGASAAQQVYRVFRPPVRSDRPDLALAVE